MPSTFSNAKMGSNAAMMMSLEKNTALPSSPPVFLIMPSLLILLNLSMPTFFACWSSSTKIPSTITTAPSIMIPKSIAPIDSRLALMPLSLRQMKAKSSASGITIPTMSVVRQSAMKRNTITVTNTIPSRRLCITVSVQYFMSTSRS